MEIRKVICTTNAIESLNARYAVRILARGWIRVLWACWRDDTAYDPSRHRGEKLLATAT